MDPAWVVSVAMLALAIGSVIFAAVKTHRIQSNNDHQEHIRLHNRIELLEDRTYRLERENETLRTELELCERERVRLMEMLVNPGEG